MPADRPLFGKAFGCYLENGKVVVAVDYGQQHKCKEARNRNRPIRLPIVGGGVYRRQSQSFAINYYSTPIPTSTVCKEVPV